MCCSEGQGFQIWPNCVSLGYLCTCIHAKYLDTHVPVSMLSICIHAKYPDTHVPVSMPSIWIHNVPVSMPNIWILMCLYPC